MRTHGGSRRDSLEVSSASKAQGGVIDAMGYASRGSRLPGASVSPQVHLRAASYGWLLSRPAFARPAPLSLKTQQPGPFGPRCGPGPEVVSDQALPYPQRWQIPCAMTGPRLCHPGASRSLSD